MHMVLKQIGENIRLSRVQKGWSQLELAGEAKVALRAIQSLEKGRGNPTIETIVAITDALGMPAKSVFEDSVVGKTANELLSFTEARDVTIHARKTYEAIRNFSENGKAYQAGDVYVGDNISEQLFQKNIQRVNTEYRTHVESSVSKPSLPPSLLDVLSSLNKEQLGTVELFASKLLNKSLKPLKRRKGLD
jgi:transcriptional regulator with XRE-family HTH domain